MSNSKVKRKITIELILWVLVAFALVRQTMLGNYGNTATCALTLVLFLVPKFIERKLNISIPAGLETIILLFIFSAEILGEMNAFYVKVPIWDTLLHTTNGFLMAAIGFSLIDIFNRSEKFSLKMSPFFVAFTAFCFSMTIGVLWEFFEFGADMLFGMDMQKDWIIDGINSVKLDVTNSNNVVHLNLESVVINGVDWLSPEFKEAYGFNGYIDIGLIDTMKDLIVNFIGAVIFSVVGVFYLKHRKTTGIAASLIPKVNEE